MKRIVSAWARPNGKRACAVCALCATTALSLSAQIFNTLSSFDYTNGLGPLAGVVQATDGNFYGTTQSGGTVDGGTVFKVNPRRHADGAAQYLRHRGCNPFRGAGPSHRRRPLRDNLLWHGASGVGTIFRISLSGTLTTLHSFCSDSGCTDGQSAYAGLIQAAGGSLYWDHEHRRRQQRRNDLPDYPGWHADDGIQLLLPKPMHGRLHSYRGSHSGHPRRLLRDNVLWRSH